MCGAHLLATAASSFEPAAALQRLSRRCGARGSIAGGGTDNKRNWSRTVELRLPHLGSRTFYPFDA